MINLHILKINKRFITKVLPVLAIVIFLGALAFFTYNYFNTKKELSEYKGYTSIEAIKEKNDLIKKIGKAVLLPNDEEPTLATVTDAYRLRDQKFFSQAENGDKVLIFAKSGRAILYRPSLNRVIEAAPVNINDLGNATMEGLGGIKTKVNDKNVVDSINKTEDSLELIRASLVIDDFKTAESANKDFIRNFYILKETSNNYLLSYLRSDYGIKTVKALTDMIILLDKNIALIR